MKRLFVEAGGGWADGDGYDCKLKIGLKRPLKVVAEIRELPVQPA